eukprot:1500622-Rhodomonas_salina.3
MRAREEGILRSEGRRERTAGDGGEGAARRALASGAQRMRRGGRREGWMKERGEGEEDNIGEDEERKQHQDKGPEHTAESNTRKRVPGTDCTGFCLDQKHLQHNFGTAARGQGRAGRLGGAGSASSMTSSTAHPDATTH